MKKFIGLSAAAALSLIFLGVSGKLSSLFSADYLPHRFCYLSTPGLVWTNVAADAAIAIAYALLFSALFWIAHRLYRTVAARPYIGFFVAFALFIGACGATHVMEIVTIWWPIYPLSAAVKVVCALASLPTALIFMAAAPAIAGNIRRFFELEAKLLDANAELREISARDSLTGLRNRGKFDHVFRSEWLRASRAGTSLAMVLMDVDCFKLLNDRYGHLAGDECLRQVAGVLSDRRGRIEDCTARYGGEEFALLLPGADTVFALRIAEEIRRAVLALNIPHADSTAANVVTVSIGVASHNPHHLEDPTELLAAADAALYRAKRRGRNCSEPAPPLQPFTLDLHDAFAGGLGGA